MSDVAWIVLMALASLIIVTVAVAQVPNSFALEEIARRIDHIFSSRSNENRIRAFFRIVSQLFVVFLILKRPTAGRVDLGCVGIVAFQVFAGWDKVALKLIEVLAK